MKIAPNQIYNLNSIANKLKSLNDILKTEKEFYGALQNTSRTLINIQINNLSLSMENMIPLNIIQSLIDGYFNSIKLEKAELQYHLLNNGININEIQS